MVEQFGEGINHLRDISKYARDHATDEEKESIVKIADDVRKYFACHNINE